MIFCMPVGHCFVLCFVLCFDSRSVVPPCWCGSSGLWSSVLVTRSAGHSLARLVDLPLSYSSALKLRSFCSCLSYISVCPVQEAHSFAASLVCCLLSLP